MLSAAARYFFLGLCAGALILAAVMSNGGGGAPSSALRDQPLAPILYANALPPSPAPSEPPPAAHPPTAIAPALVTLSASQVFNPAATRGGGGGNHDHLVDTLREAIGAVKALTDLNPTVLPHMNDWAANMGANTGKAYDPIYPFFESGWSGMAVEISQRMWPDLNANLPWPRVKKVNKAVAPNNIVQMLHDAGAPRSLDLFKIDIDSYDVFVLQALLRNGSFRPKMLVMEINEKVPPPICFSNNYVR